MDSAVRNKINIACLPKAGIGNPYQLLMMDGLRQDKRLVVWHGNSNRLIGLFLTAFKRPDYIHFDWIDGLYARRVKILMYINIYFFYIQLWLLTNVFRIKLVATLHNLVPHDAMELSLHRKVYRNFYRTCRWIRVFHAGTANSASEMYQIPLSSFKIIPEGDYTNYYKNDIDQRNARIQLSISATKRVYLFFGNIRPYKGLEELIVAFKKTHDSSDLLMIVGSCLDPTYLHNLRSSIQDDEAIQLIEGFVHKDQVQVYMQAADIVVLPFTSIENSGSVILAMGFAKPIIAPYKGVIPQRLHCQKQLLYNDHELEIALLKSQTLSASQIQSIGEQNKQALTANKWADLAQLF